MRLERQIRVGAVGKLEVVGDHTVALAVHRCLHRSYGSTHVQNGARLVGHLHTNNNENKYAISKDDAQLSIELSCEKKFFLYILDDDKSVCVNREECASECARVVGELFEGDGREAAGSLLLAHRAIVPQEASCARSLAISDECVFG